MTSQLTSSVSHRVVLVLVLEDVRWLMELTIRIQIKNHGLQIVLHYAKDTKGNHHTCEVSGDHDGHPYPRPHTESDITINITENTFTRRRQSKNTL